jgi:iron complex transport system permease protein
MSEQVGVEEARAPGFSFASLLSGLLPGPSAVVGGLLLLALTIVLATSIGQVSISAADTLKVIVNHLPLGGEAAVSSVNDAIIWQVRLPRVLTACLVGGTLALSGASYQAVFRNPLADPFLLGVAAGAGLGATAVLVSPLPIDYYRFGNVALFAFLGAVVAVLLTYQLARVGWSAPTTALVLAGVAVSAAASAGTSFLMMVSEERVFVILPGSTATSRRRAG